MGDIGEVWNGVKDIVTIFQNGQSVNMGQRAFACPAGKQPGELDWAEQQETTLQHSLNWGSTLTDWGLSSGTSLRIGATWSYGGRYNGEGRYLHDAYLWCVLDYSGLGQDFTVTGGFGDAVPMGNTAGLSGWIRVEQTYAYMHWATFQFDIRLRGTGGGTLTSV